MLLPAAKEFLPKQIDVRVVRKVKRKLCHIMLQNAPLQLWKNLRVECKNVNDLQLLQAEKIAVIKISIVMPR